MISRELHLRCPNCKKSIIFKEGLKTLLRCSKCSHFILLIRGENLSEVYKNLNAEERLFFSCEIYYFDIYPILIGIYNIEESVLRAFLKKSKRAGGALLKYLNNGRKDLLTPLEKNILYKLKAEDTNDIEDLIKEKIEYLRAKIECIKLLRILNF